MIILDTVYTLSSEEYVINDGSIFTPGNINTNVSIFIEYRDRYPNISTYGILYEIGTNNTISNARYY